MKDQLVIGTRKSALALWQSEYVRRCLLERFPHLTITLKHIVTLGDKTQETSEKLPEIGGKGLFTAELEDSLALNQIDLAVHSLKDLPTQLSDSFVIGAVPTRASWRDVFISRSGAAFRDLPQGAVVGTSSVRRAAQLLRLRPDLRIVSIRGNVDTRIRKVRDPVGAYDATLLAHAGLERLNLEGEITELFSAEDLLPAPGQGALGIECRAGDLEVLDLLQHLHDPHTAAAVGAERAFLRGLEAGCNTPVAALATVEARGAEKVISFHGRCLSPDGERSIELHGEAPIAEALALGERMALRAIAEGFKEL